MSILVRDPKYTVRVYASGNHPRYPVVQYGDLLLTTLHVTEHSRDIEVEAARQQLKRGWVAYIEIITHGPPISVETLFA